MKSTSIDGLDVPYIRPWWKTLAKIIIMCILDKIHLMETAYSVLKQITRNCFHKKKNTVLISAKSSNRNEGLQFRLLILPLLLLILL